LALSTSVVERRQQGHDEGELGSDAAAPATAAAAALVARRAECISERGKQGPRVLADLREGQRAGSYDEAANDGDLHRFKPTLITQES
jgi:hypothetical protein